MPPKKSTKKADDDEGWMKDMATTVDILDDADMLGYTYRKKHSYLATTYTNFREKMNVDLIMEKTRQCEYQYAREHQMVTSPLDVLGVACGMLDDLDNVLADIDRLAELPGDVVRNPVVPGEWDGERQSKITHDITA